MEIFEFKYKGLWLGGTIVVLADNLRKAKKLAKQDLINKEDIESLKLIKRTKVEGNKGYVVFHDDGDY